MNEQLQQLLDKQAIDEVLQRCCRTLDWLDEPGQASCYWPDAAVDFGFFQGEAAAYVPVVMEHQRGALKRWHLASGVMIQVDGEQAQAESYGITVGASAAGGQCRMYGGRYLDTLEKRDGEWRISRRSYVLDWTKVFADDSDVTQLEGATLPTLEISAPGHAQYRTM
jgi:hypothetical protein